MKKKARIFSFFIFLICCLFFMVNAHAGQWALEITATGQELIIYDPNIGKDVGNLNTSVVEIGQDPNTETFSIMPSPFPYGTINMEIEDDLMLDYRPSDSIREVWDLIVKVEQYADTNDPNFFPVLSWDTNDIDPNTTLLELRLANNDETVLVPDMSTTSSYQTTKANALATGYYAPIDPNYQFALMRYKVIYKDASSIITQEIPLREGWNWISFQVGKCFYQDNFPNAFIPEGVDKEKISSLSAWLSNDLTSPIRDAADPNKAGNWWRITSFDANGSYYIDKNYPYVKLLKYLSVGYGYKIKMYAPGTLILKGLPLPADTPLKLRKGWNIIGVIPHDICYADIEQSSVCPYSEGIYKSEEGIQYCYVNPLVSTVFSNIADQYRRITFFDSCRSGFFDILYPYVKIFHYIGPKYGYLIKIENEGGSTLIFPEVCP